MILRTFYGISVWCGTHDLIICFYHKEVIKYFLSLYNKSLPEAIKRTVNFLRFSETKRTLLFRMDMVLPATDPVMPFCLI